MSLISKTTRTWMCASVLSALTWGAAQARAATLYIAQEGVVRDDLALITKNIGRSPEFLSFVRTPHRGKNEVQIECPNDNSFRLNVSAEDVEWAPTLYYGLHKLGFLFPHPRMQITPTVERMKSVCGQTFEWRPRFKVRGLHLHTQHPNEWARGFLMGDRPIAEDIIRWVVRNSQNAINVVLLRSVDDNDMPRFFNVYDLAHELGIETGIDVTFASQQQKGYDLVHGGFIESFLNYPLRDTQGDIRASLDKLAQQIPFDFLTVQLGTSEFSSTNIPVTIQWMMALSDEAVKLGKHPMYKIHVSINQIDPQYGNYNFIPRLAPASSGVVPHTVMFYGMNDDNTPVYGRTNFADIKTFAEQETTHREVWFFPETSYWVGMDIDVPLLLTDYLVARSADMDWAEKAGITGHLDFSSGQEMGSWLFDWTVALLSNADYRGDPLIGLKLLGEDENVWKPIVDFQTKYVKGNLAKPGILSMISSSTILDEIPFFGESIHKRNLLRTLREHPSLAKKESDQLAEAEAAAPSLEGVRNFELKSLLEITWLRIHDAHMLRAALAANRGSNEWQTAMNEATRTRMKAQALVNELVPKTDRYPEAKNFSLNDNPTSYGWGYEWPAAQLHFWDREEQTIRNDFYDAFYMNIYDLERLLF